MGTRHLIIVKYNKEIKIAQYGQWDGYLDGQGITILNFLKNTILVEILKNKLNDVRFFDVVKDKDFLDEYDKNTPQWSNEPDNRTKEQKRWFETYISRDLGANILFNICDSEDKEILLKDESNYKTDSGCEYCYEIDFDNNIFDIFAYRRLLKSYNLNFLPEREEFLKLNENI